MLVFPKPLQLRKLIVLLANSCFFGTAFGIETDVFFIFEQTNTAIMKSLMTLAAALIFTLSAAFAQDHAKIEQEARAKTEKLAEHIDMTEEQNTLVFRQYYELVSTEMRMKNMEGSKEEKARMLEQYQKRTDEGIKAALDEKQYEKYMEIREKSKKK